MPTLPPTTDTGADPALRCHWHHEWIPAADAVYMGTARGAARYACTPCILALDLPIPPNPHYANRAEGAA